MPSKATLEQVRDALQALGYRAEIVDAGSDINDDTGTPGINVWMGDQSARYPDDTVWPPTEHVVDDYWNWGDRFQFTHPGSADAIDVAKAVEATVRTRS